MEKFICKIDGLEFSNQEELIEHIRSTYIDIVDTKEDESGLSIEKIYKSFKRELPDYVDIKVKTDNGDGGYLVEITSSVCEFSCQVGKGEWNYYYSRFEDVSEAVKHYKNFFETADTIILKVYVEYGIELGIQQMWESSGEGKMQISFGFSLNGDKEYITYEFDGIYQFIDSFKQYTSCILEGELEVNRKEYHTEYKIGGISIEGFSKRAKTVRLEILEYK